MTAASEVKVFQSTDAGAPVLSGTAGTLITVLDACIIDGFGSVTLDSLVVASDVATCTKSAGHGFTAIGTVGPVVRVAGASPSGLNGDWRITVVSGTVFTFVTSGISDQTATGTITAKRAPAGFSKAYSGTNKAAYRADDITGTRLYLRVDDTPAQYPTLIMYETMSDVDTGTGPSPAAASFWFGKSSAASGTARDWTLIADTKAFYLLGMPSGTQWYGNLFFGDPVPARSGDAYQSTLIGHSSASYSTSTLALLASTAGSAMARAYDQSGASINIYRQSHAVSSNMGASGAPYPNKAGNQFLCASVGLWEGTTAVYRGDMPGFYDPLHTAASLTHGLVVSSVPEMGGKMLLVHALVQTSYYAAFDISGPWR